MPSANDHAGHCRHNLDFLDSFVFQRANDWAVTVLFYSAVHIAEAGLANLPQQGGLHSEDHSQRKQNLVRLQGFPKKNYRSLEERSHSSRYTCYKVPMFTVWELIDQDLAAILAWYNSSLKSSCGSISSQALVNKAQSWHAALLNHSVNPNQIV